MSARALCRALLVALLAVAGRSACAAAHSGLEIYFVDVEGGQSTLVVTPGRRTLLIDTGWAGDGSGFRPGNPHRARDANRIRAAARDAFAAYAQLRSRAARHIEPRPGDRLPLTDVEATVVSSAGATLAEPLPGAGARTPLCQDVWQLHLSAEAGGSNFAAPRVANLGENTAHWIKLVARRDGSFRILNQRTGEWQEYAARPR